MERRTAANGRLVFRTAAGGAGRQTDAGPGPAGGRGEDASSERGRRGETAVSDGWRYAPYRR